MYPRDYVRSRCAMSVGTFYSVCDRGRILRAQTADKVNSEEMLINLVENNKRILASLGVEHVSTFVEVRMFMNMFVK